MRKSKNKMANLKKLKMKALVTQIYYCKDLLIKVLFQDQLYSLTVQRDHQA
jgi:hypothetical protein